MKAVFLPFADLFMPFVEEVERNWSSSLERIEMKKAPETGASWRNVNDLRGRPLEHPSRSAPELSHIIVDRARFGETGSQPRYPLCHASRAQKGPARAGCV